MVRSPLLSSQWFPVVCRRALREQLHLCGSDVSSGWQADSETVIYSPELLSTSEDAEAIHEVSDVFLSFGIREALLFTMVFVACSRTLFSDALPT